MYPTSEELLLKKAKLHIKLEEKEEAILTLRRILDLVPGQKEAVKLLRSMGGKKYNNNFRAGMLTDLFDKNSAQQLFTTEYGRKFNFGSILLRGNYANKFKKEGIQFEIESYLHLARWLYLDLLAGHSDISIFPEQNYIAEAYFKLPKGFETSLGFRYLMFTKVTKSYTISFSNYYKDYWFSVRTFVTPKTDSVVRNVELGKSSITLITSIRRYFGDPDNFFGVKAGQGRSPDENKALDVADFQKSTQVGIELQKRAVGQWLMKIDVTYAKENQIGSKFTKRLSTNITLKTVF
jgi:YaiO family outer membrane protein